MSVKNTPAAKAARRGAKAERSNDPIIFGTWEELSKGLIPYVVQLKRWDANGNRIDANGNKIINKIK